MDLPEEQPDAELLNDWSQEVDHGREEMDKLTEHMLDLSDDLDKKKKRKSADLVDQLIKTAALTKVAQYVGVIGYVLKQNRAMGNCIRKKRASSDTSMQEIVLECLKEYQDGQNYHDAEWTSKYAQTLKDAPGSFDTAHLEMLSGVGRMLDIENHVSLVEKTAQSLRDDGVSDSMIEQILSHVQTLGGILNKEAQSHVNFKLAAPKSERSWWSRFWSPSQKSWNPLSWSSKGRMRGNDLDAMKEMDNILEGIMNITSIAQQARTTMTRLKNKASVSHPSISDNTMTGYIKQLDLQKWEQSVALLQKMQSALQGQENNPYLSDIDQLATQLTDGIDNIYKTIDVLRDNMSKLRQRPAIRNSADPDAVTTPAEEFGALERVLERLYQNPFDEKAHFYAQRMHSRLEDRLRYIQRPADTQTEQWLNSPRENTEPISDQGTPLSNETDEGIDQSKINSAVQSLMSLEVPGMRGSQKADFFADLLNNIFIISKSTGTTNTQGIISALIDQLAELSQSTPNMQQGPNFSQNTQAVQPSAQGTTSAPDLIALQNSIKGIKSPKKRRGSSFWSSQPKEIPVQAKIECLVKMADILDNVNKETGDIIDKYIEKQKESSTYLIKFPEFGAILQGS